MHKHLGLAIPGTRGVPLMYNVMALKRDSDSWRVPVYYRRAPNYDCMDTMTLPMSSHSQNNTSGYPNYLMPLMC